MLTILIRSSPDENLCIFVTLAIAKLLFSEIIDGGDILPAMDGHLVLIPVAQLGDWAITPVDDFNGSHRKGSMLKLEI
jgi:hypothetical protein